MANTISSRTYRDVLRKESFQEYTKMALVAKEIAMEDTSGDKVIQNPYSSQPTPSVGAITGTYTVSDFTTTDESLSVADQVTIAERINDFEELLTKPNLFLDRTDKMTNAIAEEIDKYILDKLATGAGNTNVSVAGGFTSTNVIPTLASIVGELAGYSNFKLNGAYIVIGNSAVPAFIQAQIGNGFMMSDLAIKNGLFTNHAGVNIYVVRDDQLPTNTVIAGISKQATWANPGGLRVQEKPVPLATATEVVYFAYIGAKVWSETADLTMNISTA